MLGTFQEACQVLGKLMLLKLRCLQDKDWEGYDFCRRAERDLRAWLSRWS